MIGMIIQKITNTFILFNKVNPNDLKLPVFTEKEKEKILILYGRNWDIYQYMMMM